MSKHTRDLKGSTQYREMAVETRAIDEEARTVELAFSSEQPVDRMWFSEVLDHRSKSVRMDALNDGAPLLADHERNQQIGVIESGTARIDSDKMGRARVRFSSRGRGADEFQDVVDGIRTKVSVGYRIHDFEESRADKDSPIMVRVTDWEPLEVSLVSMPADSSVGVGRSDSTMEKPMKDDTEVTTVTETRVEPTPSIDVDAERKAAADKATKADRVRAEKIFGAADIYPSNAELQSLAKQCARDGTSFSDFQERAFPLIAKKQEMINQDEPVTKLGMERKEVQSFSIMRAVRALHEQSIGGKAWRETAPFEWQCTRDIEDKLQRESKGLFVPYDVQRGGSWMSPGKMAAMVRSGRLNPALMHRAPPMDTGENADLVPTEHLASDYITALRTQTVILRWGARELGGLVGNVDIPKTAANAAFSWIGEDTASPDAEVVTATVTLSPTTTTSSVPITRRLRKQSSPDVEMLVRDDLVEGAAISIDLAALEGSGAAAEPTGIMNAAGVHAVSTTAGDPTWDEIVALETAVAGANGLMGSLAYVGTASIRGAMKSQIKGGSGSGRFVLEDDVANGYPMYMQTGLATNTIMFGNGQDILLGMWGVLDIRVDTATDAAKDGTVIRVFQDVDIQLRHGESFAKGSLV